MTASKKHWNEENTVEHPIIEWLVSPNLGWRFEDQSSVEKNDRND